MTLIVSGTENGVRSLTLQISCVEVRSSEISLLK
jgi:hypothetical protein